MAKIADLKNNLSQYLAKVRRGAEIVVYDRDTPVARLVPFVPDRRAGTRAAPAAAAASAARLAGLVRKGVLAPGDPEGLGAWLDAHAPVSTPPGSPGAVDALVASRRESTR